MRLRRFTTRGCTASSAELSSVDYFVTAFGTVSHKAIFSPSSIDNEIIDVPGIVALSRIFFNSDLPQLD